MSPLAGVARALRTLWVSGVGHPDAELGQRLEQAREEARGVGAVGLAAQLEALVSALAAGDVAGVAAAQLQVWVRLQALRRGLGAHALRDRLAAGPEAAARTVAPGWTGTFHPVGAVVVPPRVQIHGVDDEGMWRTFHERAVAIDAYDPWSRPWISRVLQREVPLGRALSQPWHVVGHPGTTTAKRWVGQPAFATRPTLGGGRVGAGPLPDLPPHERVGLGRAPVVALRGPDGWSVTSDGHRVRLGPCLVFNLDKLAAEEGPRIERDAVLLAGSGERVLLQWGGPPVFPTLDPGACGWRLDDVRTACTGGWGALVRGVLAEPMGIEPSQALSDLDGFPRPESPSEAAAQAFWRQWVGMGLGRAVTGPAPDLLAHLRGAAAGEDVDAVTLLQALWSVEHAGAVEAERQVLALVAAGRPVAREGDVCEAILQARLARHAHAAEAGTGNEEALMEAWAKRIDAEVTASVRRTAQEGVLPSLDEIFWLGDAAAGARGADRRVGAAVLELDDQAMDRALVAALAPWRKMRAVEMHRVICAWVLMAQRGRFSVFLRE